MGNKGSQLKTIRIAGMSGRNMSCSTKVVRVGLTQELTVEVSSGDIWGKRFLGRGDGQCKGPEAGEQKGHWDWSREAVNSRRRQKGITRPGLVDHCSGCPSEWMGSHGSDMIRLAAELRRG